MNYFPVDGDSWYTEDGTIHDGSRENVLYLGDKTLTASAGTEDAVTYAYDPDDPAVFVGSDENGNSNFGLYVGLGVENAPNSRQDILSFLGEPVEKETYIKGRLSADVTVSSDCADTCFLVRMYLVRDGVAYNLREDITSLSQALGEYTPGDKVTLHFETNPIVAHMQAGDSLRVDISSSAAGMYSLHTNVAGNQWEIADPVVAHNTVYTGVSSVTLYTEDLAA